MTDESAPTPPVSWQVPDQETGPAPGIEFAPHGARLVAYLIDGLIVGLAVTVAFILGAVLAFGGVRIDPATGDIDPDSVSPGAMGGFIVITLVATVLALAYFPFFWARGGATPGMRPFHLRVVRDRDGGPIGWGTASLRLIGLWVAATVFYIGFIWIFIDKRHRGWQDLIAGTVMIRTS
jgi:uncharacterized RDD family membrane protein YckC